MLWRRQAIFESKGDKLSSSAEGRIRSHQGLRHQIASRLNAHWQTDWAIEDQAKNLNSTARPYDQRAFSPLHTHTYIHTYIHICCFNFDALAQGNAYKPTKEPINYRGPDGDRTHDLQTEATPPAASCPARTLHATEIAPYIHTCLLLISMLWHRQAIFESKGDKLSSSAESRIRTWKSQGT